MDYGGGTVGNSSITIHCNILESLTKTAVENSIIKNQLT